MSPKQTVVILIFLLGIFAAVLLFVPAEMTIPQQQIPVWTPTPMPEPVEMGPMTIMTQLGEPKTDPPIKSYRVSSLTFRELMRKSYDKEKGKAWLEGMMLYDGEFWKNLDTYYGDKDDNPVNVVQFGGSALTIYVEPGTSLEEIDRIFAWLNTSMVHAGIPTLPIEFRYGNRIQMVAWTTSGITLTAEQNSVVREPPQANHLRSFLLILLTAAVAVVGFSRIIDLPSDPGSRPRKIEGFISEHPGCSQKEIMDATGYSRGSVLYNLRRLEQKKIVRTASYFGSVRYFLRSAGNSAMEMTMKTIMARERPAQLLQMIAGSPGIGNKELASRMGICKTTLIWHLDRLLASEVIIKKEDGYQLSSEAESLWEQLNSLETH